MPSYKLLNATDLEAASMAAASLADQWMRNVGNIRHFDRDEMYQTNMNFRNAEDEAIYGPGARSELYHRGAPYRPVGLEPRRADQPNL